MRIRRLGPGDAQAFRALRLEALQEAPEAFGSDYAETARRPLDVFRQRLEEAIVLAAEPKAGGDLMGCLALNLDDNPKTGHRGTLTSVYVRPIWRRRGVGDALMAAILAEARAQGLMQLELFVSDAKPVALEFYLSLGFSEVGQVPNAIHVNGEFHSERLMVKNLKEIAP